MKSATELARDKMRNEIQATKEEIKAIKTKRLKDELQFLESLQDYLSGGVHFERTEEELGFPLVEEKRHWLIVSLRDTEQVVWEAILEIRRLLRELEL